MLWRLPVVSSVAGVLVLGAGAGSAFAFFTSTGSGTGYATVARTTPAIVEIATGTPAATSELSPGNFASLRLTLLNPNNYPVVVTGISQHGPITVVGGGTGCTATSAGVSVSASVASGLDITLTPGKNTITVTTGAFMSTGAGTHCQGASFHIPVEVTVRS